MPLGQVLPKTGTPSLAARVNNTYLSSTTNNPKIWTAPSTADPTTAALISCNEDDCVIVSDTVKVTSSGGTLTVTLPYDFKQIDFEVILTPYGSNSGTVCGCTVTSQSHAAPCATSYPTFAILLSSASGVPLACDSTAQYVSYIAKGKMNNV